MNKGGKFSTYEGILFTTIITVTKIQYTSVSVMVKQTGTAAWYVTLIAGLTAGIFFFLISILMERFPGKNIIEVFEAVLGKTIGKFLGLFYSFYLLFYSASILREFLEMIKAYNLPDTPPSIILITFIAVSTLFAYKGIESIVRISAINFYPVLLGIFIILFLAFPYYDIDHIKPYFGYGLKRSFYIGILRSTVYQEVMTVPIIVSSIHNVKDIRKIGLTSLAITAVVSGISFLCYLMAYQYTGGMENLSGLFQLARIIYFNRYFQRIETVFLFSWVISSVLIVSTSFYLSIRVYCQGFDIKDHRPIILPFAFILYVVTLIPRSFSELESINLIFIRQYSIGLVFGISILTLIISLILGKKDGGSQS